MDQRPLVGTGVFVMKDGKFVVIRRKSSHGKGAWGLVGGHLEYGESFEECAAREVREEVGLEIENVSVLGLTNTVFEDERKHYVTVFLKSDYAAGNAELMEPEKHDALRWVSWDEMPEPCFAMLDTFMKQNNESCLTA